MNEAAQTITRAPPPAAAADAHARLCILYSRATREGLKLKDLPELEHRLMQHLVLESFDRGRLGGEVDFDLWARELGYGDASGPRPDKCRKVFELVVSKLMVNWNRGTTAASQHGAFEILPNYPKWVIKKERSLPKTGPDGTGELPFCDPRELDEARASHSREGAMQSEQNDAQGGLSQDQRRLQAPPPDRATPDYAAILRIAVDDPAAAERMLAEAQSQGNPQDEFRRINPPEAPADYSAGGIRAPADYSAGSTGPAKTKGIEPPADYSAGTPLGDRRRKEVPPPNLLQNSPGDHCPPAGGGGEVSKTKGGGNKPSPEKALEFLRKVDRKGTLKGRFLEDYVALCAEYPDFVLGYLRGCFKHFESRYGDGPQRLKDPVGWMGRLAANEDKIRWHGRL